MGVPPVMVSIDPSTTWFDERLGKHRRSHNWNAHFYELMRQLKDGGCTHYKFHPNPSFAGMQLQSSIEVARKSVLPGKSAEILVDPKEYDTGKTVIAAIEEYLKYGATKVTVHASCGPAVFRSIRSAKLSKHVIAVTVLTDMETGDVERVYNGSFEEVSARLASIALENDVDWLVSAAVDIANLREKLKLGIHECKFATPGIRPKGSDAGGQIRISSPRDAILLGSNMPIMGRPLLRAKKPGKKFAATFKVVAQAHADMCIK